MAVRKFRDNLAGNFRDIVFYNLFCQRVSPFLSPVFINNIMCIPFSGVLEAVFYNFRFSPLFFTPISAFDFGIRGFLFCMLHIV